MSEPVDPVEPQSPDPQDEFDLKLYIAGATPRSIAAFANLKKLCEEHLGGRYRIRIVDLLEDPQSAHADEIVAIPTLVRDRPPPQRKMIGDLSDAERVLALMQLTGRPE